MSQPAACSEHSALVSRARWTKDVTINQGTEKTRGKGKVAIGYSAELRAACGQFDSDSDPTKILTPLRKLGTGEEGGMLRCSGVRDRERSPRLPKPEIGMSKSEEGAARGRYLTTGKAIVKHTRRKERCCPLGRGRVGSDFGLS